MLSYNVYRCWVSVWAPELDAGNSVMIQTIKLENRWEVTYCNGTSRRQTATKTTIPAGAAMQRLLSSERRK
jgi:hypothetical protein